MRRRSSIVVLASIWVSVLGMLASVVLRRDRGFDLTDEAFYLNSMRDPDLYQVTVTQFGFVYHPVYELLGGNLGLLRVVNALVVFLLAAIMVYRLQADQSDRLWRVTVAVGVGSAGLAIFGLGLLTPSYNSLNVIGLLLLVTGMTWIERIRSVSALAGVALASLGIFLSFTAKPTTALLAGASALVLLAVDRRIAWWNLAAAAATTGLLIVGFALAVDGSVGAFATRLSTGARLLQSLEGGHGTGDLVRNIWSDFWVPDWLNWPLMLMMAAVLAAVTLVWSLISHRAWFIAVATTAVVLVVSLTDVDVRLPIIGRQYLVLGPIVGAVLAWLITQRRTTRVPWIVWLAVLPFMYSIGSNQILWFQASMAGVFWMAALVILGGGQARHVLPIASMSVLIGSLVLASTQAVPYRQPPLRNLVAVGQYQVDPLRAQYLQDLRRVAPPPGQPVVDLTGASPGALYAMDAAAVGSGWLLGGFPGSAAMAEAFLDTVPCEDLAVAWLLTAPGGRRALPDSVTHSFGADANSDFERVAQLSAPNGVQYLLRPTRAPNQARAACEGRRV